MSVMAMGVADLKRELKERGGFADMPEIHQFLDGFYMSRIGIRILIGQHIALHDPPKKLQTGEQVLLGDVLLYTASSPQLASSCVQHGRA